nr:reverse transcriptase domain-containing protein [Tanacetum cinerariifolium]
MSGPESPPEIQRSRSRRLEDRSRTKEKVGRSKSRGKRSGHQETSSDSKYEEEICQRPYRDSHHQEKTKQRFQAFMDRFKSKSSNTKGVPPVLCISAFMHSYGHVKLAKKLNDKIPKTVEEMLERFRAFIGGEVVAGSAEMKWPQHQRLLSVKKADRKAVASGKLAHLVKDICQNNQRNGSHGRNNVKVINIVRGGRNRKRPFKGERSSLTDELTFLAIPQNRLTDEPIILEGMIEDHQVRRILVNIGSSSEIMYEHCFKNLSVNIRSRLRRCRAPLIGFSGETYHPLGIIDLRVTMGEAERNKTMLMEFVIVICRSSYNVIIGRIRMKSLGAVEKLCGNAAAGKGARFIEGEEGRFLGHVVTKEGVRVDPEKYTQSSEALPQKVRIRLDETSGPGWTNEAEEALQKIKRKLNKLQTLAIPNEGEVMVVTNGPIKEILRLSRREGRVPKWSAEIWPCDISYIQKEEAKGSVVNKFFGKGEQVQETPDASEGETSKLSKNLQAKLTPNTKGLEVIPGKRSNRRRFERRDNPSQSR